LPLSLNDNKVLKAYQVYRSIRKVAALMGCSYGSIQAVLKRHNATLPPDGFARVKHWTGGNPGPVTMWFTDHPNVALPSTTREIALVTGCSPEEINSWRTARRSKFLQMVEVVVPKPIIRCLRKVRFEVVLVDGRVVGYEELEGLYKEAKRDNHKTTDRKGR